MQPTYLPWVGYFSLMDSVDCFVLLDTVQLLKRSWQVRNRIKDANGSELLLSVPIQKSRHRDELMIDQALINETTDWRRRHLKSFEVCYHRAPFFEDAWSLLERVLLHEPRASMLADLNSRFIADARTAIGIETEIVRASTIALEEDDRLLRLVKIAVAMKADTYISAPGSADYLRESNGRQVFADHGLDLVYHDYVHPTYRQLRGDFLTHLSILDLIANVGCGEALSVIRSGRP